MDIALFRYLNSLAGHGALIDGVIVFLASYLQYMLGGTLVVLALWPRRRRMAIAAFISAFAARLVLKPVILLFVHRARPFVALPGAHNLVGTSISENLQSFPSGHALFFFALAMGVYRYDRKLGWWFFAGATLMGLARVAAGIHWPSDILAGAVIGILVVELITRLVPALNPRQQETAPV